MSDVPSIHEFDLNIICEYFAEMPRQGPGSVEITNRALDFVDPLGPDARVADLGCGTGGQTMTLAQRVPGKITGFDLFPKFIDLFNARAKELGLDDRVTGCVGSMDALPFAAGELDLIWAEGSIYNIGFERGLSEWREYLKPGGFVGVSEASWFTDTRPAEIEDFWMAAYTGINTVPTQLAQLQAAGYKAVACFAVPDSCWLDEFYPPHAEADERLLAKYPDNPGARGFIENQRHEQRLYHKYKAYYGYTFFVGQKI